MTCKTTTARKVSYTALIFYPVASILWSSMLTLSANPSNLKHTETEKFGFKGHIIF